MVTLRYRKRGDKELKNTQKVFFCSTAADHHGYFETIYDDLINAQSNISFWYPEPSDAALEQDQSDSYFADLAMMSLFVVPVTNEFLTTSNRARMHELPFALEHHIPVLPILMEQGLENLFNKSFGDLQCFSKVDVDSSAIPYATKLNQYLEAVLIRDETISKIRESFAAYIFLSYRKKDRAYAQQMMKLIHERPFCRDIAIWYDEFLAPGEDFNESIRKAFEKSGLFSLVVTPSLLEDPNYIMATEYPMARASGTPIMPLMAIPTDEVALAKKYPGIPACIPANEMAPDAIAEILEKSLDIKPNDDPEHLFFMGLAYLNGIDVERNADRALELLTRAADAGIGPAYTRISSAYENGLGVKRDYVKAAQWQERYVDFLESRFLDDKSQETLHDFISACINAQGIWGEIHDTGKTIEMIDRALKYENLAQDYRSLLSLAGACACGSNAYGYLDAFDEMGKYASKRRNYIEKKLSFAERAKSLLCDYPEAAAYVEYMYSLLALSDLAMIDYAEGDYEAAERNYRSAIDICKKQLSQLDKDGAENDSVRLREALVENLGRLSGVLEHHAKADPSLYQQVEKTSLECLKLVDELKLEGIDCESSQNTGIKSIGIGLVSLALAYEHEGRWDEAKDVLDRRLALSQRQYDETESSEALFNLATAYSNLSTLYRRQNDFASSESILIKAIEALELMAKSTGLKYVQRYLANDYRTLSIDADKQGHVDESLAYLELYERLVLEFSPNSVSKIDDLMILFYRKSGPASRRKALDYAIKLLELEPDAPLRKQDADTLANQIKKELHELGRDQDAKALTTWVEELLTLLDHHPDNEYCAFLFAEARNKLGWVYAEQKDDAASLEKAVAIYEALHEEQPENELFSFMLCGSLYRFADVLEREGDDMRARQLLERVLVIADKYPESEQLSSSARFVRERLGNS